MRAGRWSFEDAHIPSCKILIIIAWWNLENDKIRQCDWWRSEDVETRSGFKIWRPEGESEDVKIWNKDLRYEDAQMWCRCEDTGYDDLRCEDLRCEGAHMRRRCDDIRYDNQLQITHEAKVKVSLRPALMTMSRNSGGRLNVLSQHLVWTKNHRARFICWILQPWPHTELILATEAHKNQNSTGNPQAPTSQLLSCANASQI